MAQVVHVPATGLPERSTELTVTVAVLPGLDVVDDVVAVVRSIVERVATSVVK